MNSYLSSLFAMWLCFLSRTLHHHAQESFAFATMKDWLEVVLIYLGPSIVLYNVYLSTGEPIKPDPSMEFISLLTLVEMCKVLEF